MSSAVAVQHVQRLLDGRTAFHLHCLPDWASAAQYARTRFMYSAGSSVRAWPTLSAARAFDQACPAEPAPFEVTDIDPQAQAVRVTPLLDAGTYLASVAAIVPGSAGAYLAPPVLCRTVEQAMRAAHDTLVSCVALNEVLGLHGTGAPASTIDALYAHRVSGTGSVTIRTSRDAARNSSYVVTVQALSPAFSPVSV